MTLVVGFITLLSGKTFLKFKKRAVSIFRIQPFKFTLELSIKASKPWVKVVTLSDSRSIVS